MQSMAKVEKTRRQFSGYRREPFYNKERSHLLDEMRVKDYYLGEEKNRVVDVLQLIERERLLREKASRWMDGPLMASCSRCPAANCNGKRCREWAQFKADMAEIKSLYFL